MTRNINQSSYFYLVINKHIHELIYQVEIRKSAKFSRILLQTHGNMWTRTCRFILRDANGVKCLPPDLYVCKILQVWRPVFPYLLELNPVKLCFSLLKFDMSKQSMRLIFSLDEKSEKRDTGEVGHLQIIRSDSKCLCINQMKHLFSV